MMIKPTIGRVVWLRRPENTNEQAEAVLVTYVHSDSMINVAGWNHVGTPIAFTSVLLQQEEMPAISRSVTFAEWMPYQKGQAAKADAAEKAA